MGKLIQDMERGGGSDLHPNELWTVPALPDTVDFRIPLRRYLPLRPRDIENDALCVNHLGDDVI